MVSLFISILADNLILAQSSRAYTWMDTHSYTLIHPTPANNDNIFYNSNGMSWERQLRSGSGHLSAFIVFCFGRDIAVHMCHVSIIHLQLTTCVQILLLPKSLTLEDQRALCTVISSSLTSMLTSHVSGCVGTARKIVCLQNSTRLLPSLGRNKGQSRNTVQLDVEWARYRPLVCCHQNSHHVLH